LCESQINPDTATPSPLQQPVHPTILSQIWFQSAKSTHVKVLKILTSNDSYLHIVLVCLL